MEIPLTKTYESLLQLLKSGLDIISRFGIVV